MNTTELIEIVRECGALGFNTLEFTQAGLQQFAQRIEQRQWRPIETCPKCKAVDVMCRSNLGNTEYFVRVTNATQLDSGRWLGLAYWHVPTHWMPIPALPEGTE